MSTQHVLSSKKHERNLHYSLTKVNKSYYSCRFDDPTSTHEIGFVGKVGNKWQAFHICPFERHFNFITNLHPSTYEKPLPGSFSTRKEASEYLVSHAYEQLFYLFHAPIFKVAGNNYWNTRKDRIFEVSNTSIKPSILPEETPYFQVRSKVSENKHGNVIAIGTCRKTLEEYAQSTDHQSPPNEKGLNKMVMLDHLRTHQRNHYNWIHNQAKKEDT